MNEEFITPMKCCLQQMLIELYKQKSHIQRGGRVIEEPMIRTVDEIEDTLFGNVVAAEDMLEAPEHEITLEEMIRIAAAEEPPTDVPRQIHIDEAIAEAESNSTESKAALSAPKGDKPGIGTKLRARLVALNVWRVERARKQYELARTKTDVANIVAGIDIGISVIEQTLRSLDANSNKVEQ